MRVERRKGTLLFLSILKCCCGEIKRVRKEGTWTQILTALSQIRRLKGNPGSDYNVTEIPKYFKMDQGSISLLETTVCKLIFFPPLKLECLITSNLNLKMKWILTIQRARWEIILHVTYLAILFVLYMTRTSWEDMSVEMVEITTRKPTLFWGSASSYTPWNKSINLK